MTIDERCVAAAAAAWVNKRGTIELVALWFPAVIQISVRTGAEHEPPLDSRPGENTYMICAEFPTQRIDNTRPVSKGLRPPAEELDLARGYVRLVRTLMGDKGDKVEVQYVGFE